MGAQSSMSSNAALYKAAATSGEATHHQEDTLKNQGKSDYYNDHRNDGHLAENLVARENSQSAETSATNRVKTGVTPGSVAARQAITDNKRSKGAEKIIDQGLELSHQASDVGRTQAKELKGVEGELEIVHDEQKLEFSGSPTGTTQAQTKKVIQGKQKVVDGQADTRFEISPEGRAASIAGGVVETQLGAAKAANSAEVQELKAGTKANGFDDPDSPNFIADKSDALYVAAQDLSIADIEARAQAQRTATGTSQANVGYAEAIMGSVNGADGGALINTAQGIGGGAARTRAVASAVQTIDKQLTEAIATQKSNQESHDPDRLFSTMMDTTLPAERRAAAAGLIMSRGGDQHVEEVIDYLGTAVPTSKDEVDALQAMQKQVSADIGSRKPQGLGRTDLSRLAQGSFGAANVKRDEDGTVITDPATGKPVFNDDARQVSFEDSLMGRVNAGKIGTEQLAKMGADELARLAHAVETRGNEMDSGMYLKLQQSIGALNDDANLRAAVDTPEQQALLNNILNGAGVNGAIKLQNLEYTRTKQPKQTL